jgi:glycosyltransferase involved in cell wall biosynthesis
VVVRRTNIGSDNIKSKYSLSVGVPCYNEAENLERVVEGLLRELPKIFNDFEIILVNDGSRDDTGIIADRLSKANSHIRVVHHPSNQGYGAAVKSGYYASTKELVCLYPGDGQFDIAEIKKLLPLMEHTDIAATHRLNRQDPFHRKVNQFLYNRAIWLLFGIGLKDIDCGFKLMKREIFEVIQLETKGALIDAEFYFKAKRKGFTYIPVGVNHYPRLAGSSTGAKFYVIFHALYEILRFWWKIRKYR